MDKGALGGVGMTRTDSDIVPQQETRQKYHQMGEMVVKAIILASLGAASRRSSSHAFLHAREASFSQVATLWRGNYALWPAPGTFLALCPPLDHREGSEAVTKGINAGHEAVLTGNFRGRCDS